MTELMLQQAGAVWRGFRQWDRIWLLILAIPAALMALDPGKAEAVLSIAVRAFRGTLPFMAVAVGLIAWLKATGAGGMVAEAFKGRESRMIVLAALVGGLMPFCSCEVIPFIAAWAAAEEGVRRFVYLSSLLLMDGYDADLAVTERWKTLPTTDVPCSAITLARWFAGSSPASERSRS